jgi:hypothetical protein
MDIVPAQPGRFYGCGAISKVPNRSEKVILISPQARQDLIINGLRFRNEFGMTLYRTFDTAPIGIAISYRKKHLKCWRFPISGLIINILFKS